MELGHSRLGSEPGPAGAECRETGGGGRQEKLGLRVVGMDLFKKGVQAAKKAGTNVVNQLKEVLPIFCVFLQFCLTQSALHA